MKTIIFGAVVLLAAAITALAADTPLSGTWKISGSVYGNAQNQTCTFKQEAEKITGTCKSDDAKTFNITGEVKDKKVSWKYDTEYNGTPLTVIFTGDLDAQSTAVSGKIKVQPFDIDGDFTAKKQEEPKAK